MGDVLALLFMLALQVVSALLAVPLWRSGRNRKWCYFVLLVWEVWWWFLLGRLYALVGVPFAWQVGADVVLFALMVATLVLLYRHRHEPDVDMP